MSDTQIKLHIIYALIAFVFIRRARKTSKYLDRQIERNMEFRKEIVKLQVELEKALVKSSLTSIEENIENYNFTVSLNGKTYNLGVLK